MTPLLSELEQTVLVDRLAEYTTKYTELLASGGKQEDISRYRYLIEDLLTEIGRRKQMDAGQATS